MEGNNPPQIADRINNVLGDGAITARTCQQWVSKFNKGIFQTDDSERGGRPSIDIDDQIVECLQQDKYATTTSISNTLECGKETVREHLLKMGKKYLCNRWLPHKLTEENCANRERVCNILLNMFHNNNFLARIITVDEIWIYWESDRSYHNRSWFGSGDMPTTSIRPTRMTNKKFLASVFWDSKGLLLFDVLPPNVTLNSEIYCGQIEKLEDAIQSKRRRPCKDHYFLQDNARPHIATTSINKLKELGFNILSHPPYSPDLSPSDFYLFHPMKSSIRNRTFNNSVDIQNELEQWFSNRDVDFFCKAFDILPQRWQMCVDAKGSYFQKLLNLD